MRKRKGSKKLGKSGNGNVFQNLMKIVVNFFEEKYYKFFFYAADPEILSCTSQFFNKEGEKGLKLVLQPNFLL